MDLSKLEKKVRFGLIGLGLAGMAVGGIMNVVSRQNVISNPTVEKLSMMATDLKGVEVQRNRAYSPYSGRMGTDYQRFVAQYNQLRNEYESIVQEPAVRKIAEENKRHTKNAEYGITVAVGSSFLITLGLLAGSLKYAVPTLRKIDQGIRAEIEDMRNYFPRKRINKKTIKNLESNPNRKNKNYFLPK